MKVTLPLSDLDKTIAAGVGEEVHDLIAKLFPICRSITGNGVRQTLRILQEYIPLDVHEVPSGTPAFDWTIPKEWNIQDAYVLNERGEKVIDFAANNLHVLNYSIPVNKQLPLQDLKKHLFSLPDQPDLIPYKTSYYKENWGFCLADRQLQSLEDGLYTAVIDATLEAGSLTYGELYLPGETAEEILISSHICHPSLCNDNLSGIAVATFVARELTKRKTRYSYRLIFIAATIGAITWLSQNETKLANIRHGLVLTLLGDEAGFTYKRTREGSFEIDNVVEHVLLARGKKHQLIDFFPYGYDERQFCSPGFNLPVGCLMRSQHGEFPEYHTSADNLDFVKPASLEESVGLLLEVTEVLEQNRKYRNTNPKCEPQLGKRGLYNSIAGSGDWKSKEMAMFWLLNLSDGRYSLLDITNRSGISFKTIAEVAEVLQQHALLEPLP